MNARDLMIKFSAYRNFVLAREWLKESPQVPKLLFVVPDPAQEQQVELVARHLLAGLPLPVYITTVTRLAEDGPLEPIWLLITGRETGQERVWCSWQQGQK